MSDHNPGVAGSRRRGRQPTNLFQKLGTIFPLLIFPVLFYFVLALFSGGNHVDGDPAILNNLDATFFSLPMISNVRWSMSVGDALLLATLLLLSFELMKSTSSRSSTMINHMASMGVLLLCIVLFLLVPNFATATFFLMTIMVLMDVMVGVIVSIVSARRDFGVGDGFGS
jgi:hypothetical protein